jgi:hypothetical protein
MDLISPERRLAEKYRAVFLKDSTSIDVFEELLTDLRLYETIETEEDRYLHNFAIRLLNKMAIYDGPNMRAVTRNLAQIPMPPPRDEIPESGTRDIERW